MVSGKTAGTIGVFLGTLLIIFDATQAGLGVMLLGILAAILLTATDTDDNRDPRP